MSIAKTVSLALAAFLIPHAAIAQNQQELNELRGYSPPPMFGASPPPQQPSAPGPAQASPPPGNTQPVKKPQTAEDLLAFPANDDSPAPKSSPLIAPTAVPAPKVETALPLPGSVSPTSKNKTIKTEPKIAEKKKAAPKKPEKKLAEKAKVIKKNTEKKKEKPAASASKPEKPAQKPVLQQALPVQKAPEKKAEAQNSVPTAPKPEVPPEKKTPEPVPVQAKPSLPDLPVPDKNAKPYRLDGKRNMPAVKPADVDKTPLPELNQATPSVIPSANEQLIDKALRDRLMKPDVKSIIKSDAVKVVPKAESKSVSPMVPKVASPPVASVTAIPPKLSSSLLSMEYKAEVTTVQDDQKKIIDTDILPKLRQDKGSRLQILSYASATKDGQSSARRISLARSLDLRAYLLEQKIQPSRIDIRALGDKTEEKPLDRVDLRFIPSN